jgi:hypothetical protein
MARLGDIATGCRSKNAGPFDLTVDVIFDDAALFAQVRDTGVLNAALFARLYDVQLDEVQFTVYAPGLAFKATLPRLVSAGDVADTDVYGAQQHAPVLEVEIPL